MHSSFWSYLDVRRVSLAVVPGADNGAECPSWVVKLASLKIQELRGVWFLDEQREFERCMEH